MLTNAIGYESLKNCFYLFMKKMKTALNVASSKKTNYALFYCKLKQFHAVSTAFFTAADVTG